MGGRLADRAGGRERREGPRPRATDGGRQGLPLDALAEGRTRPRAGGLLQDLDRPEGRQADQGVPVAANLAARRQRWSCGVRTSSTRRLPADTSWTEWLTAPMPRTAASTLRSCTG